MVTISDKPAVGRWRRYLRFSLRGVVIVVVLIGCGLGWIVSSARRQRAMVLAIEKSGGGVQYDWQYRNGGSFALASSAWPKWLLDRLPVDYFHGVTWVLLGNGGISDPGMLRIGDLKQLEELHIRGSQWTDAGLANLRLLPKLRRLHIQGPSLTDAGWCIWRRSRASRHLASAGAMSPTLVWCV